LRLTIRYLNATINRKTRKIEPEIATDGSSQTRQNLRVDGYVSWFCPPRRGGWDFWTILEPNQIVIEVRTRTAGRSPGSVANATDHTSNRKQPPKQPAPVVYNVDGGQHLEQPAPVINTTAVVTSEEAKQISYLAVLVESPDAGSLWAELIEFAKANAPIVNPLNTL
jgi:hypothetical protein